MALVPSVLRRTGAGAAPHGAVARAALSPLSWSANTRGGRYSRRVALLKLILPAIGVGLLLIVAVWPRVAPLLERMRLAWPAIDLREARELRMLNPRYLGTDRQNRPFVVIAAVGRQVPDRQDLMSFESPRADMKTHGGADIVVTAASGIYQSHTQLLDLFGDVTMVHENGTRFLTQSARLDAASNAAEGHEPVEGHGPSGDVSGQGFRILDKGDTIIFDGKSALVAKGAKMTAARNEPPTVPPAVAATAVRAEAAGRPAGQAAAARKPAPKQPAAGKPAAKAPR